MKLQKHSPKCLSLDMEDWNYKSCFIDCPMRTYSRTGELDAQDMVGLIVESEDYSDNGINSAALIKTKTGYAVVHVNGCSCWEGEGTVYIGRTKKEVMSSFKAAMNRFGLDSYKKVARDLERKEASL